MGSVTESESVQSSRLVEKLRRFGFTLPLDLERLAMARGCHYYERDLPPRVPPLGEVALSNAELAIALIVPALKPSAREIRLAAALLGAPDNDADEVVRLAREENCADVVKHIAQAGFRFEANNLFWSKLLELLRDVEVDTNSLPHPTRFVEMTGIDRGKVGVVTRWIRPLESVAG